MQYAKKTPLKSSFLFTFAKAFSKSNVSDLLVPSGSSRARDAKVLLAEQVLLPFAQLSKVLLAEQVKLGFAQQNLESCAKGSKTCSASKTLESYGKPTFTCLVSKATQNQGLLHFTCLASKTPFCYAKPPKQVKWSKAPFCSAFLSKCKKERSIKSTICFAKEGNKADPAQPKDLITSGVAFNTDCTTLRKSKVHEEGDRSATFSSHARRNFLEGHNVEWSQLFTWIYFLAFLIIPICALLTKAFSLSELVSLSEAQALKEVQTNHFMDFIAIATQPIALSAYSVTFSMAAIASLFNAFFGFILAWVLVRYNFPFKRFLDAAIDLPFAVPTSVAGLTLATVYSPQGWIGSQLQKVGIQVIYTRLGVATAMVFVSLPFVVRSLQPVLQEIDEQIEEAAFSLGASPYTTFRRLLFPPLLPAFLTGVTLGFSRAIGEYGSLVLVSSNIPYKDLIASVLIFQNLESYSLGEATVIATVVLLVSFSILLAVSSLQSWTRNRHS